MGDKPSVPAQALPLALVGSDALQWNGENDAEIVAFTGGGCVRRELRVDDARMAVGDWVIRLPNGQFIVGNITDR